MVRLVACGKGGTIASPKIVDYVISLTGKRYPKILYLGTFSEDNEETWKSIGSPYIRSGCSVTRIKMWDSADEHKSSIITEVEDRLRDTDIILLSGGRSLPGIKKWKEMGVDKLILDAVQRRRDIVLAGGSAGALVWFGGDGLNLVPALLVPHYDTGTFHSPDSMLTKHGTFQSCICVDEHAGFVILDEKATVISDDGQSRCYYMTQKSMPIAFPIEINEVRLLADLEIEMP